MPLPQRAPEPDDNEFFSGLSQLSANQRIVDLGLYGEGQNN
jgi:hypothetical protein